MPQQAVPGAHPPAITQRTRRTTATLALVQAGGKPFWLDFQNEFRKQESSTKRNEPVERN